MIVFPEIAEEIGSNLRDAPSENVFDSEKKEGNLILRFSKYPRTISDDGIKVLDSAVMVFYKGKYIFAATLEKTDLRSLSLLTGRSVKNLQDDYQVKSFFTEPRLVLYGNNQKEDLGLYTGETKNKDNIIEVLLSYVMDAVDTEDEEEPWQS